ncbi:hypothetical protein DCCM_2773 [Desulfocucumis palustris]|uniref:Uncharacterized protein n=1 Tax=Desulfocucumis palustris TaxID=1898651 RepID=A0A2L2XBI3_9FIRM|nr:hypothetical protein DCCM_2773 [Desulfocucumis palustris]
MLSQFSRASIIEHFIRRQEVRFNISRQILFSFFALNDIDIYTYKPQK